MKTKIAMSLGLVLVMFLGVVAVMLALAPAPAMAAEKSVEVDITVGSPDLDLVVLGDIPIPLASAVHINARALNLVSPATFDDANLIELTITIGSSTGPPVATLEVLPSAPSLVGNGNTTATLTDSATLTITTALGPPFDLLEVAAAPSIDTTVYTATFVVSFINTDKFTLAATTAITIDVSADNTIAGSILIDQEGSVTTTLNRLEFSDDSRNNSVLITDAGLATTALNLLEHIAGSSNHPLLTTDAYVSSNPTNGNLSLMSTNSLRLMLEAFPALGTNKSVGGTGAAPELVLTGFQQL